MYVDSKKKKRKKNKQIEDTVFYEVCALEKIVCAEQRGLLDKMICMQRAGGEDRYLQSKYLNGLFILVAGT